MGGTCTSLLAALFVATLIATFGSTTASSPPKITMAPKDVKTIDENYVSFFCKASGNPAPIIHWEKDGKKVVKIKPRLDIFEAPHISSLRIKPKLSLRDNATYTCVASNPHGEAKADATLKIYPKSESGEETPPGYPTILTHPKLKSVEKDRPIQLACEVKGDPKPKVLWLKDNLPLDTTDARVEVLESGYLTIMHSQESDEGTYECAAENEHGVTYSYRAMVYIRVRRIAPKFNLQMPNDVKIMPGSDLNLTCVAVGSPMPYVKWRQGAKDLTSEDEAPIGRNVLILTDVRESANYTCEASSDLGNIEHMTQVIVEGE
nr:tyrosine-protein phosphatase Lar [Biomphalaria glabrata]